MVFSVGAFLSLNSLLFSEVILQYFNTDWSELAGKMPELAEVGYMAIWLPPPTKASGGLSTGYDCWDPFDLGGKDQRNSVRTKYGTEADLLNLIETAHRFGIRVYFDNIMNHRAFDVPGYDAATPIDVYPGMVPEDFHLRVTEEGFYRKWDNVANWSDTWQIQYRNFSDLIDIAQESPDNGNFGQSEGDHIPKIEIVRHPDNPEYYDYHPTYGWVGFGSTSITAQVIADNQGYYEEDVNSYLIRAVRWLVHHTKVDGLRLDAVKHVPAYFFGEQWAGDKDSSSAGYCGQAQWQFNMTRGFSDWDNHRDTVFDSGKSFGRNDLMMFGEHLGAPPPFEDYIAAGMRLVDSPLHGFLNGNLGQPWGNLAGLQYEGGEGFAWSEGVTYVKSHDDDYATRPELQFALNLTRRGLPNVYTDGNYQSETLGESGGAFPRHANIAFLGQFGDSRIPNLVYIHNHFARGEQWERYGDGDIVAYDRVDKRENGSMADADGAVLFFVMNDDYSSGQYREMSTTFRPGDHLWQYSTAGGNFYYEVTWDQKIKVITPPGGYFAFSWRSPEESDLWAGSGGNPITIQEDGGAIGWISYERIDGPDGDPAFNPYGVQDDDTEDFTYTYYVPRVTSPTNLRFAVRVDGSAKNVLLKLDGGIGINAINHGGGDARDYPPGNEGSTDVFLGYEQIDFVQRQYREKFAAADVSRNVIGSLGAETYVATIGSSGFTVNTAAVAEVSDDNTADWVYHEPGATNEYGNAHFWPAPQDAGGSDIYLWVKIGYQQDVNRVFLYYTIDGQSWPEGAGGETPEDARIVELQWGTNGTPDGGGTPDWWTGAIPAVSNGTVLRYKIGAALRQNGDTNQVPYVPWYIAFPNSDYDINNKKSMMGVWEINDINPSALVYYPHNDFDSSSVVTGLVEGFHVARARAFLDRDDRASIYNTFVQPFYYDTETPDGMIVWPGEGDTLYDNSYGAVVLADPTAIAVWYHIEDSNPENDDGQTGQTYGNGTNALGEDAWAEASQMRVDESLATVYSNEWRFNYENVPTNSPATIYVKLGEISSSTNPLLSAVDGHFTLLTRNVTANGPDFSMFVAYPEHDGDTINLPYEMKVRCSKTLWDGFSTETLRSRFLIKVDGNATDRNSYNFNWSLIDGKYYDMSFALPNLYDGDLDKLHEILVTHTNAAGGGITLTATRLYKAAETDTGPYVDIVQPPEFDSDGKPYEIILPDIPNPTPEDRQFTIRVETDLDALHCWIEFTNSSGQTIAYPSTTNSLVATVAVTQGTNAIVGEAVQLTGTVSALYSNTTVTGTGTAFLTELEEGNRIVVDSNLVVVSNIASNSSLTINAPYPGSNVTGEAAWLQSAFDAELNIGSRISVDGNILNVETIDSPSNLTVTTDYPGTTTNGLTVYRIDGNPTVAGNKQNWNFFWTNMTAGEFTFYAFVNTVTADTSTKSGYAIRNTKVILREQVPPDENDDDDDDDGLSDSNEGTPEDLPDTNPETWVNGDVHIWEVFGRTDPLLPDTDGDLLPDGLESGWRVADTNMTDITADTNGDGFPNFIADLDPPFYNTVPDNSGLPEYVFNDSRTKLIHGSLTDAQNPDSDYDGIPDGTEDWNRNGLIDGDGLPLQPTTSNPWDDRPTEGDWPDGEMDTWETWQETDPNNVDTDGDLASDGYGEDIDFDGWIDGDPNSNRVHEAGELWQETDPLNPDCDGDGLPDGWERQYSFDPFDDGIIGHTNMSTGVVNTNDNEHGANGNPDGDQIVQGGFTNDYVNIMEFENGTNPRIPNSLEPPPDGSIIIGPGDPLDPVAGVTNYQEFMDWTLADCIVLDEYEGDGGNNQKGDLYLGWDGWDTSRDIVAFYAHDGGDTGNGGDGNFYFRVDFHDLRALAEEENLDFYVVIDTGNPAEGEMNLPDEVDTITWNRWEAVVAVYQSSQGRVYIDTQRANNTTTWGEDLFSHGVIARDQNSADGFVDAYFNAGLDAVEFAISRQALIDAGWSGSGASNLNYQVFTTKDGTGNDPRGDGDIGGRSDVRDAIYNDYIAEDYWQSQDGLESILKYWVPASSKAGRSKVAIAIHGNQAIQPGSDIQNLANTGSGAGYYRPLDAHGVFGQALNLHIAPTLASAIEWAAVDPGVGKPWRDGPALNDQISELMQTNIVDLMASTFSDHMLPYFTKSYNRDNETLARSYLGQIYGFSPVLSSTVFWAPERLLDVDSFDKITDMGYQYTVFDQNTHMFNWFGRTESLIEAGYRLNEVCGVKCFVINDIATSYLFSNTDGGVDTALRSLFSRKARSGVQDQVITMASNWETFTSNNECDAYDANIRWIANRPWVHMVTLEQIAAGEVDVTGDDVGDSWYAYPRGYPTLSKQAHNWLNHASQENYDNWYVGSAIEESLEEKIFEIRPGTDVPQRYGMLYSDGIISNAWSEVDSISNSNVAQLARAAMHASTFQTAFHDEDNNDLRRYSTGSYMYPATGSNTLATFSLDSQSQTRFAAIYKRVDDWAAAAAGMATTTSSTGDVDLDGESEYLLYNNRLFVVFEAIGGRIIGVWVRDALNNAIWQAAGNFASYPGTENEREGQYNVETNGTVVAFRTSCLKDWWADIGPGTFQYVNDMYSVSGVSDGWQLASSDFNVTKTVTLAPSSSVLEVSYALAGDLAGKALYVRNGLSPALSDLLLHGQQTLGGTEDSGGVLTLSNTNYGTSVSAFIGYSDGSHSAIVQTTANDDNPGAGVDFDTINMRNQAQTHQVEVYGVGNFTFSLGFGAQLSDWDGDGMPNQWEDGFVFLDSANGADGAADQDGDTSSNSDEYLAGTGPDDDTDYLGVTAMSATTSAFVVRFPAKAQREYRIWYENGDLVSPSWSNATPTAITVPLDTTYDWVDDGSTTYPHPLNVTGRFYKVEANLAQ